MEKTARWMAHTSSKTILLAEEAAKLTPRLIRKPIVVRHCLLRAHWAQLILVCTLLLMPSIAPSLIEKAIDNLSPASTSEKFSRFFNNLKADPELETHQVITRTVLWSGSTALVLIALFLQIPRAVADTHQQALQKEQKADALAKTNPNKSIIYYQSALNLTLDPNHEQSLTTKIQTLKTQQTDNKTSNASNDIESTKVVSINEEKQTERLIASRYRLINEIGRGAMGLVYKANDVTLERDIALKQLAPHLTHNKDFTNRFLQEARALAKLSHPHIIQIYDLLKSDNHLWIAMELVDGTELADKIRRDGPISLEECIQYGMQLSEAMEYAHKNGVIHRDFKPANVLVSDNNSIKVMDFGLAKITHSSTQTQVGTVMGSPAYMSPEQASGKSVGPATDIYALGITLYLMTTGKLPFMGDPESIIAQHLTQTPVAPQEHNPNIPDILNDLILNMLAKDPADRPQSMQLVTNQLVHSSTIQELL